MSQASTEDVLQLRGGKLAETVQVLAYDLTDSVPDLEIPDGPQAELVPDERTLRASHLVSAEVWDDHRERTPAAITEELAGLLEARETWSDVRVVEFLDSEPAAGGGCGLVGQVARLWGAGTRPAFRGRGAYRALLAARIALAREHGATLALVKGRVETSGPILRRAGFTAARNGPTAYRLWRINDCRFLGNTHRRWRRRGRIRRRRGQGRTRERVAEPDRCDVHHHRG